MKLPLPHLDHCDPTKMIGQALQPAVRVCVPMDSCVIIAYRSRSIEQLALSVSIYGVSEYIRNFRHVAVKWTSHLAGTTKTARVFGNEEWNVTEDPNDKGVPYRFGPQADSIYYYFNSVS
jgi:hypothetical protein